MDYVVMAESTSEQYLMRIAEQYTNSLLRTGYVYLRDAAQAQDIVQEVILRAWTHIDTLRCLDAKAEKAWLVKTTINLCRDYRRSRWFRHTAPSIQGEARIDAPVQPGPEDNLLLLDVMNLPEKYKEMILLYYYQELTLREAAQVLGVSHTVAQRRLKKAVELLGDFEGRNKT